MDHIIKSPRMAGICIVLLALTSCSPAASGGSTSQATTVSVVSTTADATATGGSSTIPTTEDGVSIADSTLGPILTSPEGLTMYAFTQDNDGSSTCYDACAVSWPHVPADTPMGPDVDSTIFGTTTRNDGSDQLTVAGHPLYLFAADQEPGDLLGQGLNGVWFAVSPDGSLNEESTGQSPPDDDDYGY